VHIKVQSLEGQLNTCSQRNLKNKRPFFNRCCRIHRRDESVYANGTVDEGGDRRRLRRRCHKGRKGIVFTFRGREARSPRRHNARARVHKLSAKPRGLCISDCCALYFLPPAPRNKYKPRNGVRLRIAPLIN